MSGRSSVGRVAKAMLKDIQKANLEDGVVILGKYGEGGKGNLSMQIRLNQSTVQDKIDVLIEASSLAKESGIDTRTVYPAVNALAQNNILFDSQKTSYGIQYTVGYKNPSGVYYIPLEHAIEQIKGLSTLKPKTEKGAVSQMMFELATVARLYVSASQFQRAIPERLKIYRDSKLTLKLAHLAEYLVKHVEDKRSGKSILVNRFLKVHFYLTRQLTKDLECIKKILRKAVLAKNSDSESKDTNTCKPNNLSENVSDLPLATTLYIIINLLKEINKLFLLLYRVVAQPRSETFSPTHGKYVPAGIRSKPELKVPENLPQLIVDWQEAYTEVFHRRFTYAFLSKKIPDYFIQGFTTINEVYAYFRKKYKNAPSLRKCITMAFAYHKRAHKKFMGVPPPNWISQNDYLKVFEEVLRKTCVYRNWKAKNRKRWDGSDSTIYEDFLAFIDCARTVCRDLSLADPVNVGGKALRDHNRYCLLKSMRVYVNRIGAWSKRYGLEMTIHDYLYSSFKELKKRKSLTYEDLGGEGFWHLATDHMVRNERYSHGGKKPAWIAEGAQPPSPVSAQS